MKTLYFIGYVLACFSTGYFLAAAIEKSRKKPPVQEPRTSVATMHIDLDFTQFESEKK